MELKFEELKSNEQDVLEELFLNGPTWDGYIVSKTGRDSLCDLGLAEHRSAWAFLTRAGVMMAITADVRERADTRWRRKQQTSMA